MASTITFCADHPIQTKGSDWMADHIGRCSVGRKQRPGYYEIIAYSDNKSDFPELSRMARREKATFINSFISDGVTATDSHKEAASPRCFGTYFSFPPAEGGGKPSKT